MLNIENSGITLCLHVLASPVPPEPPRNWKKVIGIVKSEFVAQNRPDRSLRTLKWSSAGSAETSQTQKRLRSGVGVSASHATEDFTQASLPRLLHLQTSDTWTNTRRSTPAPLPSGSSHPRSSAFQPSHYARNLPIHRLPTAPACECAPNIRSSSSPRPSP